MYEFCYDCKKLNCENNTNKHRELLSLHKEGFQLNDKKYAEKRIDASNYEIEKPLTNEKVIK